MDEKSLLAWFEQIGIRITNFRAPPTGETDAWASLFTEMQTALESIFPQSHPVLRRWEDALSRGKQSQRGNRLETPEKYVSKELMGTFEAAYRLLQEGHARRFADGIRAETIAQCLDQAETLARARYATAAMVLAGGALETHLLHALRHSIAIHLLEAGRGIEYVADHLGHKNIRNTRVYAQITNPLREQVFQELEQHPKIVRVQ